MKIQLLLILILSGLIFPSGILAQSVSYQDPIVINSDNYKTYHSDYKYFGPFIPRAVIFSDSTYESQILGLETIKTYNENVSEFRVGFSSINTVKTKLTAGQIQRLKSIGVTTLTYNPEGGHTPEDEFARRFNADSTNPIVEFAKFAQANGFNSIWVPLRLDADKTSDTALAQIYASGIDGLALQEQNIISAHCISDRVQALDITLNRHQAMAGKKLELTVQVMSSYCTQADTYAVANCGLPATHYKWQHCDSFIDTVSSKINLLSIWTSINEVAFIKMIRDGQVIIPTVTPTIIPPTIIIIPTSTPTPTLPPVWRGGPGDANRDSTVDGLDYQIWLKQQGRRVRETEDNADFNHDNYVNELDLQIFLQNLNL